MDSSAYVSKTLVMCLKEFIAVLVQLICYERLGVVDLFQGGLILYMILVVFNFPFLNSYLFGFLRFGMWFKNPKKDNDAALPYWGWVLRTCVQFIVVTIFQVAGALCAAEAVKKINSQWVDAGLYNAVNGSVAPPVGGNPRIGVSYRRPAEDKIAGGDEFFDEFCAVFMLLIGLLHLIASDSDKSLLNTYWHKDAVDTPSKDSNPMEGFSSSISTIGGTLTDIKETVDGIRVKFDGVTVLNARSRNALMPLPPVVTHRLMPGAGVELGSGGLIPTAAADALAPTLDTDALFKPSADEKSLTQTTGVPPTEDTTDPIVPIPSTLILHASILIIALTRAFPSAHQSLHLTVYYWQMNYFPDTSTHVERIAGGYAATIVACIYYWFWYVYVGGGKAGAGQTHATARLPSRLFMGVPAFMSSELRLPHYMRIGEEGEAHNA